MHTNASALANGSRETGPAVCKGGRRRRPGIPSSSRQENEDFLPCRHRRRHSVYPRSKIHGHVNKNAYELFADNGTLIATYGTIAIYLNLSLRRALKWHFPNLPLWCLRDSSDLVRIDNMCNVNTSPIPRHSRKPKWAPFFLVGACSRVQLKFRHLCECSRLSPYTLYLCW